MMNYAFERTCWKLGVERVAGVDEAGRGPLAGPVVAAAVIFPQEVWIHGVDDSKKLGADHCLISEFWTKVQPPKIYGDPAGIGPEICAKAALDPRVLEVCDPVIYTPTGPERFAPGVLSAAAGRASYDVLLRAVADAQAGVVDAIATAPVNKEAFKLAGDPTKYPDQIREGLRPWQASKLYFAAGFGGGRGGRGARPRAAAAPSEA